MHRNLMWHRVSWEAEHSSGTAAAWLGSMTAGSRICWGQGDACVPAIHTFPGFDSILFGPATVSGMQAEATDVLYSGVSAGGVAVMNGAGRLLRRLKPRLPR